MSTAMNFGAKSFKPRPPDKGAFPLDHFGECSAFKERFMECLRASGYESGACRQHSMAYLECRMERQVGPRRRAEGQPGGSRGAEAVGKGREPAVEVFMKGACVCEEAGVLCRFSSSLGLHSGCGPGVQPKGQDNNGITEQPWLEMTSKITQSNH
ncbi:cytochrome c oxidase assembly protein COX19 isoform 1-T1 [Podargus strigoides]